jgi:hypothetical protein
MQIRKVQRYLLEARCSDPTGRVLGIGGDHRLQKKTRFFQVTDLKVNKSA